MVYKEELFQVRLYSIKILSFKQYAYPTSQVLAMLLSLFLHSLKPQAQNEVLVNSLCRYQLLKYF